MNKLLTSIFIPFILFAETPELWQAAKVSKKLNDSYTLASEGDFRFFNMGEQLKYYHGDIGISFPLTANFNLSVNFREVFEYKNDIWNQEHRPHGTISTKMKKWILGISARSRFEYRMKQDKDAVIRNRDMVTVKFDRAFTPLKLVPYMADEIFYDFENSELNRNRFYVGTDIKSIPFVKAAIYFLQQSDLSNDEWESSNIVGMKFSF